MNSEKCSIIPKSQLEKVENLEEQLKKVDSYKKVAEAGIQLYEVACDGTPENKLLFLKGFVTAAAEFIELPGVHSMLQATAAAIGSILESIQSWKKSIEDKTRLGEIIWNKDIFNEDVKTALTAACELRYGAGARPIVEAPADSENSNSNDDSTTTTPVPPRNLASNPGDNLIVLSSDAKSWFIKHADILEKATQAKLLKFKDDGMLSGLKKRFFPTRAVDEPVMQAWIRLYWPVASYVAFGETASGNRFCMCRADERLPGSPQCW